MAWAAIADLTGPPGTTDHGTQGGLGDDDHPHYLTNARGDVRYQPLDTDLTALAALAPADDSFIQRKSGVWVARSTAQVLTDLAAVPTSRILTAGVGLTGGGTLAADRSFAVAYGSSSSTAVQGNDTRVSADQAAGTASIRTLGTGSTQAAAGNHTHTSGQTSSIVARAKRITTSTGATGTVGITAQGVLRLDAVAMRAGRLYRVVLPGSGIQGTVAGATAAAQLTFTINGTTPLPTSTVLTLGGAHLAVANQGYNVHLEATYAPAVDLTFRVLLSIWRQAGTGTITMFGDAIWPIEILVEDLGIDPGDTGVDI